MVGAYQGEPVWIEIGKGSEGLDGFSLVVSLGEAPLQGFLCTADCAGDGLAQLTGDVAFDQAYACSGEMPREVAVLALQDPEVRAAVHRRFHRVKMGYPVAFQHGYVSTSGEFFEESPLGFGTGPSRPPTPEEAAWLVADLVLITQRFRWAYQTVLQQMAQTQGQAAADQWHQGMRAAQVAATKRTRRFLTCFVIVVIAVSLWIIGTTLAGIAWFQGLFG